MRSRVRTSTPMPGRRRRAGEPGGALVVGTRPPGRRVASLLAGCLCESSGSARSAFDAGQPETAPPAILAHAIERFCGDGRAAARGGRSRCRTNAGPRIAIKKSRSPSSHGDHSACATRHRDRSRCDRLTMRVAAYCIGRYTKWHQFTGKSWSMHSLIMYGPPFAISGLWRVS